MKEILFIYLCQGDELILYGSGSYPENNICYPQSDELSEFSWIIDENSTLQGSEVSYIVEGAGLLTAELTVEDQYGCSMNDSILIYSYVDPIFTNTGVYPDTICLRDTVYLTGNVQTNIPDFPSQPIALPDDANGVYQTSLTYTVFPPDAYLTDINDLQSVCINMEHSFPGDLTIRLYSPSGQFVELIANPNNCGNNFMGEPVRTNTDPLTPGIGYEYCWSPASTIGTLDDNAFLNQYSYTDVSGNDYINQNYFPADTYEAEGNFNNLLGSQMHGDWTIFVYDNLIHDNGFLFDLSINFNMESFIEGDSITFPIEDRIWVSELPEGNIINQSAGNGVAVPLSEGEHQYTFKVESMYGCSYDTTVSLYVGSNPIIFPGNDTLICNELSYTFNATIIDGTANWTHEGPGDALFSDDSSPTSLVTVTEFGEYTFYYLPNTISQCLDTHLVVVNFYQLTSDFVIEDPSLCFGDTAQIEYTGISSDNPDFIWQFPESDFVNEIEPGVFEIYYNQPGTYNVSLMLEYSFCISDLTQQSIIHYTQLEVDDIETINNPCFGDCLGTSTVIASGGLPEFSYTWFPELENENNQAFNLCAGIYNVTVTDDNSCTVSSSFEITEPDLLDLNSEVENISCNGLTDGFINTTVTGGTTPYDYQWSDTASGSSLSNLPQEFYYLTVTDANNCIIKTQFFVKEPYLVITEIMDDTVVCKGDIVELYGATTGGTPDYTYLWTTNDIFVSPEVIVTNDTIITLIVQDANGCLSDAKNVDISIFSPVQMYCTLDDTICTGLSSNIETEATGGDEISYSYFLNGDEISDNYSYTVHQTGMITVQVKNICESKDTTILITALPLPEVLFSADRVSGCQPLEVYFTNLSNQPDFDLLWDFNHPSGFNTSSFHDSQYSYTQSGTYDVSLQITDNKGCVNTSVYENMIAIYPPSVAEFVCDPITTSILDPEVYFNNYSSNSLNNYWNFGDGDHSNIESPLHSYNVAGTYNVELFTESEHGCTDSTNHSLMISDVHTFYAPTAITPDHDGRNDSFFVQGYRFDPDEFKLIIYDRWGELIFETDNLHESWNGIVKGRSEAQTAVYTWFAIYIDLDGHKYEKTGTVTVIR